MEAEQTGLLNPAGLAFSSSSKTFYVAEDQGQAPTANSEVVAITSFADQRAPIRIAGVVEDPLNMVFDNQNNRLLVYQAIAAELSDVRENPIGNLERTTAIRHKAQRFNIQNPQGLTIDEGSGALFILDAGGPRIVRIEMGPGRSFTGGKISVIDLKSRGLVSPRGIAFDPTTGHLHVLDLINQRLYELTLSGQVVATRDLIQFGLKNPQAMVFAPSGDQTDDASQMSLFLADSGLVTGRGTGSGTSNPSQTLAGSSASTQSTGQIVELSFLPTAALPPGTSLLPTTMIHVIDASNTGTWNPSAPDTTGIDYWPLTGRLLVSDSEVDEMSNYFTGKNVYDAMTSGTLISTCSTTNLSRTGFSNEPTGLAINRNNNRIYFTDDDANKLHEVSLGSDGTYCTGDDGLTTVNVGSVYNIQDAEDVAYADNALFIAGGIDAEVYKISLGGNGVLGGGDDGLVDQFDTASLGFSDLEGIGYNWDTGMLFILSAGATDKYAGQTTLTGTLLNAYNLDYAGLIHREDVTFAPGSQDPAIKNMYVTDRGVDNDNNPNENDGQIWEFSLSASATPTPSPTRTHTPTSTNTPTPAPSSTPTITASPSSNPLLISFVSAGSVGGVSFADEDIVQFDGTTWSLLFDGSDVGVGSPDLFAFSILDADTILMSFGSAVTVNGGTLSVTPQDVVRFDATSLGINTAGSFSMYLDGSTVGLDTSGESIDSVSLLSDGRVLMSTTGNLSVTGVTGADEDILAFTPTSGTWSLYFDGSDVGLADTSNEDVDALDLDPDGAIYLSTLGDFSVAGVAGFDEDVFVCSPTSLGSVTACNYSSSLYFDGSLWGLSANGVDGFNLFPSGTFPTATPTATRTNTPTMTATSTPTNTPTDTPTPTPTDTPTSTPTDTPTNTPTNTPIDTPTPTPTDIPMSTPADTPTNTPTNTPTDMLTPTSTDTPTSTPIDTPTNTPTDTPTLGPTFTPTPTFTASPTSAVPDSIFADGFESGNLSAWAASTTNGGNLSVSPSAALAGSYGLRATFNNTSPMYVRNDSPNAEPRYRARWYFNPNSITMANRDYAYLLQGHNASNTIILFVQFYRSSAGYQLRARARDSILADYVNTPFVTITDAVHYLEVDWGNDGHLTFWVDGVEKGSLTGINNSNYTMDSVRLGAPYISATATSGSYFIDAFESRRETYIGP